jgi:hypothetical protein
VDHQNSTATLAHWLGDGLTRNANFITHLLFVFAAFLLVVAALIRTWASLCLQANVAYAAEVKTESLVAHGPYRRVRNPLYFGNVSMAIGMGAMMSRTTVLGRYFSAFKMARTTNHDRLLYEGNESELPRPRAVPSFDHDLLLGEEFEGVAALSVKVTVEARACAAEGEKRHWGGHPDVDAYVSDLGLAAELARAGAARGEQASHVPGFPGVHDLQGLLDGSHSVHG